MKKRTPPNLYTIPPGADFAAVAVAAILDGELDLAPLRDDPLGLADLVIYVPSRRIAGLVEAAFAQAFAPRPVILPKIRPLREPDDALERLAAEDAAVIEPEAAKRPLSAQERRYRLFPLVAEWLDAVHQRRAEASVVPQDRRSEAGRAAFLAEAMRLSTALGALIDEIAIEGLDLSRLASVTPDRFDPAQHDEYWWMTRDFLRLAAERWPLMLESLGAEDQTAAELRRIAMQANRLADEPPAHPVIILGSTGSVKATADLMGVVASLPQGAVVFPGLDLEMDDASWALIGADKARGDKAPTALEATRFAHPQAMLKRSLELIGASRKDVRPLGTTNAARLKFLSESFRPADLSDRWQAERAGVDLDAALAGVQVLVARDERQEASAIALALRETLHNPDQTAALVTADRKLARRVRMELKRHGIEASDSAGQRLSETAPGLLIRLLLAAERERSGATFLALLRHPLMRMGVGDVDFRACVDAMELLVWRGRHFTASLSQEARVIAALSDETRRESIAAQRVNEATRDALPAFAARLDHLIGGLASASPHTLAGLASALVDILHDATRDENGTPLILADPHWAAVSEMLEELQRHAGDIGAPVRALEPIVEMLLAERSVPGFAPAHPRCAILGLLEARLVHADRVIIGGMNEGSLPPAADADPFLNRTMRLAIGLQPPERRIGQSAHDLMMLGGNPDLVLTHARRIGTQPGIPSRFVRRMAAFVGKDAWETAEKAGATLLALADLLDQPAERTPAHAAPAVTPALLPRVPQKLSITEVETLRRDPYALYAKKLLRLEALEAIDSEPDARERGTLFHEVIEAFAKANPPDDPDTALQILRDIARDAFAPFAQNRERHHFWWQSFEAIMPGIVALHRDAQTAGREVRLETRASHDVTLTTGDTVRLGGRIDRIELGPEGVTILDFKTGSPPSKKAVFSGNAPQLPITAALVARGAVEGLAEGQAIARMGYVPIGGKEPVEIAERVPEAISLHEAIEAQYAWLINELTLLASGEKPYRSRVAMQKTADASDYDHLARVLEWSLADDNEPPAEAEET